MESIAQYPNLQPGQWIFTCSMKPLQFSHIESDNKKIEDYPGFLTRPPEEWEAFRVDDFITMEGSSHSKKNCSCKPISEAYAKWFLENEIHLIFDKYEGASNPWDDYMAEVKIKCEEAGITYEGI